jgi:hypothetical protein
MKSTLTQYEFKERLEKLTAHGDGIYFFTPYDFSGKPFFGTYDDTKFQIRRNSFWRHVIAVEIKGEYKPSANNLTEVNYEVKLSKFGRYFTFIIGGLSFVFLNILLIIKGETFDIKTTMVINGFWGFAFLLGFFVNWITKKIVNQRFKEEFKIGIKDELDTHSESLIYRRITNT